LSRIHLAREGGLARELAGRVEEVWNAYLVVDQEAHSAVLADDYRAVHPDGSVHAGKPSVQAIAAAPIEDYWLREFQAWPVGDEGAIVSYTAEIEVRVGLSAQRHQLEVGEVWMKHGCEWKCRYYHATPVK